MKAVLLACYGVLFTLANAAPPKVLMFVSPVQRFSARKVLFHELQLRRQVDTYPCYANLVTSVAGSCR